MRITSMEYQEIYNNTTDIILNDNPNNNSKNSWSLPSDGNSMDNNNEYFEEWNTLKIDEDNGGIISNNSSVVTTNPSSTTPSTNNVTSNRKRKLISNQDDTKRLNDSLNHIKTLNIENDFNEFGLSKKQQKYAYYYCTSTTSIINRKMSTSWQVEDITDLNGEIDSTLSLSSELANNTYNVNDSILSISGLTVFKQEIPSPTEQDVLLHQKQSPTTSTTTPIQSLTNQIDDTNNQNIINNTINQLLSQSAYNNLHNAIDVNLVSSPTNDNYHVTSSNLNFNEDCRFQYVLAAATSIATKINEDTLTYLNQGQSYEIKLKKLGDLSMYRGKMLKSIIRICFHERRLQYMEKEQMTLWQRARPGDRILEVDVPLSYGAFDIIQPQNALNIIHFNWDPTKEVGIYIKVNCISTEFTPKKHGGEKGVPFRIQVETYQNGDNVDSSIRLHAAACQIKVFKLKGADRKHKQDREKIMKRPLSEQEKYQPSYECTVLNDIQNDAILNSPPIAPIQIDCDTQNQTITNIQNEFNSKKVENTINSNNSNSNSNNNNINNNNSNSNRNTNTINNNTNPLIITNNNTIDNDDNNNNNNNDTNKLIEDDNLMSYSTTEETINWLRKNRFGKYINTFANFSGADMLRMTRNDLLEICGNADGIRLYNAVHLKPLAPKLMIYVCLKEDTPIYNAIILSSYNDSELLNKLINICGITLNSVSNNIYMEGPQGIKIKLTNDVISHIKEETVFLLDTLQENGKIVFILKR